MMDQNIGLFHNPTFLPTWANLNWGVYAIKSENGPLAGSFGAVLPSKNIKAIVRADFSSTVAVEFYASRLARFLGLPAPAVQVINLIVFEHLEKDSPLGALVCLVPSTEADWILTADSEKIESAGIDLEIVARIKAFELWSNQTGSEYGKFRLTSEGIPFTVDHQDAFFFSEYGLMDVPLSPSKQEIEKLLPDEKQRSIAKTFYEEIRNKKLEIQAFIKHITHDDEVNFAPVVLPLHPMFFLLAEGLNSIVSVRIWDESRENELFHPSINVRSFYDNYFQAMG
ncbi:MAG: hypothetical protein JEZ06_15975 [Anaerolineaceae bacterium]|nr:hypothetical protein [Anaerolineaceae bacterium]